MTVRVRYAPSPTGYLHVGGARTALFNWLYARHTGGKFLLRIEDTDRKRYVQDALTDFLDSLRWLGLDWDEGPEVGGPFGPYFQSQRLPIYQEYAGRLVAEGHAYRCYCSPERLEALRREQRARRLPIGYDRHCRRLTTQERAEFEGQGIVPVIRLAVPLEGETNFHDAIYGDISFEHANLEDIILLKSDGYPTYHLANVVDDHLMQISHIMRGDEWLSSVPLHVLLYRAFGWPPPVLAHLPLILNPSGKGKMSKRKTVGAGGREYPVLVKEFRQAGYLPEAMFNFLTLIGWAYDEKTEILTREQIIGAFDLPGIKKSPGAFSYDKLDWMNGVYIRMLDPDDLARRLLPFVHQAGREAGWFAMADATFDQVHPLVPLIQERIQTLAEAPGRIDFFFVEPPVPAVEDLVPQKMTAEETARALRAARETLATLPVFDHATIEAALRGLADRLGMKAGPLFTPIRLAVTGRKVAPPLFETLACLGREKALARVERAERELLGTHRNS
jgi:glutamyl-tRNA synthetase